MVGKAHRAMAHGPTSSDGPLINISFFVYFPEFGEAYSKSKYTYRQGQFVPHLSVQVRFLAATLYAPQVLAQAPVLNMFGEFANPVY